MKSFGPFTGRQLTTMFITLMIAIVVAIPATAFAVTFTNVAITDPGGVNRAKVSTGGALSVSGTATVATPSNLVRISGLGILGLCSSLYTVPAGKALILTSGSIHAHSSAPNDQAHVGIYLTSPDNPCFDPITEAFGDATTNWVTTPVDYGSGLALPTGTQLAVAGAAGNGVVELHGYLVPASAVPAAATASPTVAAPLSAISRG
jgi:hypothetical protein